MHAMKELNVARNDIQAIGKRSPLVTPLSSKDFWVVAKFDHERAHMAANLVSDPPVSGDVLHVQKLKIYLYVVIIGKLCN